MAFKPNKNWLLLTAAVLLGVGAVYLSNDMIKSRMAQLEDEARRGKELVPVVVASRDLDRGDAITPDVMSVRQMPKEFVHHSAVAPGRFGEVENQRLAAPLKRGEALLDTYTEGQGAAVFSATLKKGWRALTFEVDTVNSISGMLRPGDRIDLIYTAKRSTGPLQEEVTVPLLSDVTVLATGQSRTKRDEADGKERTFSAVTMELAPRDADRVIVARTAGRLTAVLRHPDDRARNDTRAMTADALLAAGQARRVRTIEFIGGPPATVVAVGTDVAPGALAP